MDPARRRPRLPAWPRLVRGLLRLASHRLAWSLKGGVLKEIKARGRVAGRELEGLEAAAEQRRAPAASQERGRQERQTWLHISCCARRR